MLRNFILSCADVLVFNEKGEVLILQRGEKAPWMPLKWGLPGGHVDPKESLLISAKREVKEEAGLEPENLVYYKTIIDFGFLLSYFISFMVNPKVKISSEHNDYKWISKKDLETIDFVPNLKLILEKCLIQQS